MAPFEQRFRVYYQDTDATGVVFHAAYLNFAERGRVDSMHDRGAPAKALGDQHGAAFLVRRASIDYVRPLRLDDEVTMRTSTHDIARASFRVRQDFLLDGVLAARVWLMVACVRVNDGRPVRLPEPWRGALVSLGEEGEPAAGPADVPIHVDKILVGQDIAGPPDMNEES